MFGIGTGELLLLLVLALLVLGPERMPKLARDLGKTVGDLRKTSDELRNEFLNADRSLNLEKAVDAATRVGAPPSETGKAAEMGATMGEPAAPEPAAPDAGATQAAVTTEPPAEGAETAFDREMREARERVEKGEPTSG